MAGDTPEIPPRYLYSAYHYGGTLIPADIYFACLDGTFNADKDSRFGEMPADQPDLYPELVVGRIPVSKISDATILVNKIISYETPLNTQFNDRVCMLAEVLAPSPWSGGRRREAVSMAIQIESRNAEWAARAARVMPHGAVGVSTGARGGAFVASRGEGSKIYDADGNAYIDYVLGSGPLRSTTVDGVPGSSPASSTAPAACVSSAGISPTERGSAPPWRLALVDASTPQRSTTALASPDRTGTRIPTASGL